MNEPNLVLVGDELRTQIKNLRTELRNRGLKERFHRKDWTLSDQDIKTVLLLARKLKRSIIDAVEQLAQQRKEPEITRLAVRDGQPIDLCRIIVVSNKSSRRYNRHYNPHGALWLSNGQLLSDIEIHPQNNDYAILNTNEYVLSIECSAGKFSRSFGADFVASWLRLDPPPREWVAQILLQTAGLNDSPQEALITWLLKASALQISRLEDKAHLARMFVGAKKAKPIGSLAELLHPVFTPQQSVSRFTRPMSYENTLAKWAQPIVTAIERYLRSVNLITPDLRTGSILKVSLRRLVEWSYRQDHRIQGRARELLEKVAESLGFKKHEATYAKALCWAAPASASPNSPNSVTITDKGQVSIGSNFRCIVEAKSAALPDEDQIVRRMWTLATAHRNQISTLTPADLKLLEDLFPVETTRHIWDDLATLRGTRPRNEDLPSGRRKP